MSSPQSIAVDIESERQHLRRCDPSKTFPFAHVAYALECLCQESDAAAAAAAAASVGGAGGAPRPTVFDSRNVPPMSVFDYARRICKYSQCSDIVMTLAFVFIHRYLKSVATERANQQHYLYGREDDAPGHKSASSGSSPPPSYPLTKFNVHRLLVTAAAIAAKEHDDVFYSVAFYASVGGVSTAELSRLEVQLLTSIHFDLWIEEDVFTRLAEYLRLCYDSRDDAAAPSTRDADSSSQSPSTWAAAIAMLPRKVTSAAIDYVLQDRVPTIVHAVRPVPVRLLNDSLPPSSPSHVVSSSPRLTRRSEPAVAIEDNARVVTASQQPHHVACDEEFEDEEEVPLEPSSRTMSGTMTAASSSASLSGRDAHLVGGALHHPSNPSLSSTTRTTPSTSSEYAFQQHPHHQPQQHQQIYHRGSSSSSSSVAAVSPQQPQLQQMQQHQRASQRRQNYGAVTSHNQPQGGAAAAFAHHYQPQSSPHHPLIHPHQSQAHLSPEEAALSEGSSQQHAHHPSRQTLSCFASAHHHAVATGGGGGSTSMTATSGSSGSSSSSMSFPFPSASSSIQTSPATVAEDVAGGGANTMQLVANAPPLTRVVFTAQHMPGYPHAAAGRRHSGGSQIVTAPPNQPPTVYRGPSTSARSMSFPSNNTAAGGSAAAKSPHVHTVQMTTTVGTYAIPQHQQQGGPAPMDQRSRSGNRRSATSEFDHAAAFGGQYGGTGVAH